MHPAHPVDVGEEKSEKNACEVHGAEEVEGGWNAVHQGRCPRQNTRFHRALHYTTFPSRVATIRRQIRDPSLSRYVDQHG